MEIEVSLKVRSAIKAKLLELGCHVDEELPDYVMILVANRRTKTQMDADLNLFLGENTEKFTTWLHHVLKKLEQVTLTEKKDSKGSSLSSVLKDNDNSSSDNNKTDGTTSKLDDKKKKLKEKSDKEKIHFSLKRDFGQTEFDSKESEKKSKQSDHTTTAKNSSDADNSSDILNLAEEQNEFAVDSDLEELRRLAMESKKRDEDRKQKGETIEKEETKSKNSRSSRKIDKKSVGLVQGILHNTETKRKRSSPERSRTPPKRLKSVIQKSVPDMEEYDPTHPTIAHKLSSVVHVTSRPKRENEANKNLLFKAMKDAEIDSVKRGSTIRNLERSRESRMERLSRHERRSRSRSRNRDREPSRSFETRSHHQRSRSRSREKVARNPVRSRSRSRSPQKSQVDEWPREKIIVRQRPLELFTRKNRVSVKDRLGERPVSRAPLQQGLDELEMDQGEELDVKNFRVVLVPEREKDRMILNNYSEDAELIHVATPPPSDSPHSQPPKRISIKVNMNSSDEEDSDDSDVEEIPQKKKNEEQSDSEIDLTVGEDKVDELLPPSETSSAPKPVDDKLADLRARLASLNAKSETQTQTKPAENTIPVGEALPVPRPHVIIRPAMITLPGITQGANTNSTPLCKYWPNCSYLNNCKYQHPKCKYGPLCKKPSCPYKHEKKVMVAPKKKICSWFPKCHTLDCPFFHPKPCRYGINCTDVKCSNYHPGGSIGEAKKGTKPPAVHLLKWSKENVSKDPNENPGTVTV